MMVVDHHLHLAQMGIQPEQLLGNNFTRFLPDSFSCISNVRLLAAKKRGNYALGKLEFSTELLH